VTPKIVNAETFTLVFIDAYFLVVAAVYVVAAAAVAGDTAAPRLTGADGTLACLVDH
jgi:hypothetical protein